MASLSRAVTDLENLKKGVWHCEQKIWGEHAHFSNMPTFVINHAHFIQSITSYFSALVSLMSLEKEDISSVTSSPCWPAHDATGLGFIVH